MTPAPEATKAADISSAVKPSGGATGPRPVHLTAFVGLFKRYMSYSTVAVAVLPIGAGEARWIPTWGFQTHTLSVYTGLFCFLLLTFLFSLRHALARGLFSELVQNKRQEIEWRAHGPVAQLSSAPTNSPRPWWSTYRWSRHLGALPFMVIAGTLLCVALYHIELTNSVFEVASADAVLKPAPRVGSTPTPTPGAAISATPEVQYIGPLGPVNKVAYAFDFSQCGQEGRFDCILKHADALDVEAIEGGTKLTTLMLLYLGIFVGSESAFVLLAIREYLQGELRYSEQELILGLAEPKAAEAQPTQRSRGAPRPSVGPLAEPPADVSTGL